MNLWTNGRWSYPCYNFLHHLIQFSIIILSLDVDRSFKAAYLIKMNVYYFQQERVNIYFRILLYKRLFIVSELFSLGFTFLQGEIIWEEYFCFIKVLRQTLLLKTFICLLWEGQSFTSSSHETIILSLNESNVES